VDKIIDIAQDLEKLVLVSTNIVLAIYGFWSTIRAKRWRQTANFIGQKLVQEESKIMKEPKTKDKLVFASPRSLKTYVQNVKM